LNRRNVLGFAHFSVLQTPERWDVFLLATMTSRVNVGYISARDLMQRVDQKSNDFVVIDVRDLDRKYGTNCCFAFFSHLN
jgi:hypothetical protein